MNVNHNFRKIKGGGGGVRVIITPNGNNPDNT